MAALGLQRAPALVPAARSTALTYISIIVPEIVIALATLVFFASTSVATAIIEPRHRACKIGFGYHTIVGAARAVQHQPRAAARPGPPVGHGPDAWSRRATTCSRRRGGRSGRSRSRSSLPAIVAGFLLSFTFSFDDYVITTFVTARDLDDVPLYVFGQIRKGVTPATNAVAAIMLLRDAGHPARRPVPAHPPGAQAERTARCWRRRAGRRSERRLGRGRRSRSTRASDAPAVVRR